MRGKHLVLVVAAAASVAGVLLAWVQQRGAQAPVAAPEVSRTAATVKGTDTGASAGTVAARSISPEAASALEAHGADYDALLREPALTRYLVIVKNQRGIPDALELQQAFLDELSRDPERGLQLLSQGLANLPKQGYAIERTALLTAGLALAGKEQDVKKLAYEELTTNPTPRRPDPATARTEQERGEALSTTWDMARAINTYEVMLRTSPPQEIFESTVTTISAQPDAMVRERMAAQFFARYPAQESDLRARLSQQKMALPGGS